MQATNHVDFIVGAYTAAVVVVGGLIAWVLLDYRAQLRKLADMEKRGFTRRVAGERAEPTMRQAKEDA
ncbi:MAG: heme exporter protein CcmD [Xanthobacteraceae bacterium]